MAQRRYGPLLGPGVAMIEADANKAVQAAPIGETGFVGILEKGPINELISCSSLRDFTRKCGGRIAESQVPDAAQDFWLHGNGAGELHLIRVTDGNQVKAFATVYNRASLGSPATAKSPAFTITAKNGGRWGGRTLLTAGLLNSLADVTTENTVQIHATYAFPTAVPKDYFKGAYLKLDQLTTKSYLITGNTAGTAPLITVTADSTILTDLGGSLTDPGYAIELTRDTTKELTYEIGDGEADATTLWSLKVFADGDPVLYYPNLSMDPNSAYYFVRIINDDPANYEIEVTDLNAGDTRPSHRPANFYGLNSSVSATVLTVNPIKATSEGTGTYSVALDPLTDAMKYPCTIECTVLAGAATMNVDVTFAGFRKMRIGAAVSLTAKFDDSPFVPAFTLTPTSATENDVITIEYFPFAPDALIGGWVYPNYVNYPNERFRIKDNTNNTITINSGDLTTHTTTGDTFMVVAPTPLYNGYDGVAAVAAAHYTIHFDTDLSEFNDLAGQNKGEVRLATPGIYKDTNLSDNDRATVQKALMAYAEAKNYQAFVEIDPDVVSDSGLITEVNSTLGRNTFAYTYAPTYGWVSDPDKRGQDKFVTLAGAILGRAAGVARDYGGYHKVPAGIEVDLPRVKKLDAVGLNEELLTPQGINVIKKVKGRFILWGARSIAVDSAYRFYHHRAMMSHYEHILQENFDWAIFQINDPTLQAQIITALREYFVPEWRKRALRGTTFEEACVIKCDNENNTDATRAAGDLYADINLQLADTVERFIITMSKDGVFEQTA